MDLQINRLSGWIVTDEPRPTFSITLDGTIAADCYRVSVEHAGSTLWTSEKLSIAQLSVQYAGPALSPKSAYRAVGHVLAANQIEHRLEAVFETGFLGDSWQAAWIEPEQETAIREKELSLMECIIPGPNHNGGHVRLKPCQVIRRDFILDSPPRKARIYASAHGIYELQVNGQKTGINRLAPETSAYQHRLYYQSYDVTDLLRSGENSLSIILADGWWIGRIGLSGESCQYGDKLGLILQLEITGPDGSQQLIGSDESFLSRRSHIDYADLFIGERQDLVTPRAESWLPCRATDCGTMNLFAQPIAAISELAGLPAVSIFRTPSDELVADFGQVIAGVVEMTIATESSCEIVLDHSEVLDASGNFFRNILGRNKDQRDVFVCPPGRATLRPLFTYHGFRFVRISGIEEENITGIKAIVLGTAIAERGCFSCSDPGLNQLQANIRQSAAGNMFSVPTDCPQREKMGWTGDIQVFAKTGCFNFDLYNFLDGWLANMRLEQKSDGEIPIVIPNYPLQQRMQKHNGKDNSSSAWSDACILVPLYLYQYYGNAAILEDNLAMMERWLEFVARAAACSPPGYNEMSPEQQARNPYLWNKGHHFGDWLIPSLRKQPGGVQKGVEATFEVIASCFYAVTVKSFIEVLDALSCEGRGSIELNKKRDYFSERLAKIRQAVRDEYIGDDGIIRGDLQGLYVMALHSGAAAGDLAVKVAARLAWLISQNGDRLDTGFVSTPYLLDVLVQYGHRDLAYRLLFQTQSPSWLYSVEKGATSIWENWEAILPDGTVTGSSFNHYAFGCVGDWIYRQIGGIAPLAPGFRKVIFQPDIDCGLESARCAIKTAWGQVSCSWRWQGQICQVELTIPPGLAAVVKIREINETLPDSSQIYHFKRPK